MDSLDLARGVYENTEKNTETPVNFPRFFFFLIVRVVRKKMNLKKISTFLAVEKVVCGTPFLDF